MDYLDDDIGYECTYRYNTHHLGTIAVKFDVDLSQIAYCVCSRVLIDYDEQESRNRVKRKKRKKQVPKNSAYTYNELDVADDECIKDVEDGIYQNDFVSPVASDRISPVVDVQTTSRIDMGRQYIHVNGANNVASSSPISVEPTDTTVLERSCCGLVLCWGSVVMYIRKKFETVRQHCSSCHAESISTTDDTNKKITSIGEIVESKPMCFTPEYKYDPVNRAVIEMQFKMIAGALKDRVLGVGYNEFEVEYLNKQHGIDEKIRKTKAKRARCESTSIPNSNLVDVIPITMNKRKNNRNNLPPEIQHNADLKKYWSYRHSIFTKYDEGIRMDEESWYSVTPEAIAAHIADVCACETIIDGFCGAGGNTIQFAFKCKRVIAIDINPQRIEIARNNAKVYGVEKKIVFIVGDFFEVAPKLKADVVFLSPPWGGPNYLDNEVFSLRDISPKKGKEIYDTASRISNKIAYYLPRNIDINEVIDLVKPGQNMEIEQQIYRNKIFSICVYFDQLALSANELIQVTTFKYQGHVVPDHD